MSERTRSSDADDVAEDEHEHDPDLGSTWNTLRDTAEIEDLLDEQEIEDFMEEPTEGELGILSDTDVPGRPG